MLPVLLILYGEDEMYGDSRYGAGVAANQYGGDRYSVDIFEYETDAGLDRYAELLDGGSGYTSSTAEYDQQRAYDADEATGYGFLDLSVPYQGMYEPSYRLSAL